MTRRTDRLGSVIQEEITTLLSKGRLKDPRIAELTTITGVRVSRDLAVATVFFTVLGEQTEIETTAKGLTAASGFIQRHLAKHMTVRIVPAVRFEYDPSVAYGDRINRILSELPEIRGDRESAAESAEKRTQDNESAADVSRDDPPG